MSLHVSGAARNGSMRNRVTRKYDNRRKFIRSGYNVEEEKKKQAWNGMDSDMGSKQTPPLDLVGRHDRQLGM